MGKEEEYETIKLSKRGKERRKVEKLGLEERLGPEVIKRLEAMAHEFVRFERGQFGFYIDPARYAVKQRQVGPLGKGRRRKVVAGVDKDGNVITAWIGVDNNSAKSNTGETVNIPRAYEEGALGLPAHAGGGGGGPGYFPGGPGGEGPGGAGKELAADGTPLSPDSKKKHDEAIVAQATAAGLVGTDGNPLSPTSAATALKTAGVAIVAPPTPADKPDAAAAAATTTTAAAKSAGGANPIALSDPVPPPKPTGTAPGALDNAAKGKAKKPLHWAKVPNNLIPGTVWSSLEQTNVVVSEEEVDGLFGLEVVETSFQFGVEEVRPDVLPHKRKHNVNILLANLKMTADAIKDVIRQSQYNQCDAGTLQALLLVCPTPEEEQLLIGSAEKIPECDGTDNFMYELALLPGLRGKILCALSAKTFNQEATEAIQKMDTMSTIQIEIQQSGKLSKTLETILAIGNYLNSGTARGGAHGFKLEALAMLGTVKDASGGTLLDFVVSKLRRDSPGVLPIDDMPTLPQSNEIGLDGIQEEVLALLESVTNVGEQIKSIGDDPSLQSFKTEMEAFQEEAIKTREEIVSLRGLMMNKLQEMMGHFGERNKAARGRQEDVMRMLREFLADIDTAIVKANEKAERNAKKDGNAGGSGGFGGAAVADVSA